MVSLREREGERERLERESGGDRGMRWSGRWDERGFASLGKSVDEDRARML